MIDGFEPETVGKTIGYIIGAVIATLIAAFFGRSVMMRRASKDKLVIAGDDGHRDIIAVLRDERTTLVGRLDQLTRERDEAVRAHADAMLEIGGLRKEVEHLTDRVKTQTTQILNQSIKIEALERNIAALNEHIKSLVGLRDVGLPLDPKDIQ